VLPALVCALGVGGCLLAEARGRPGWLWLAKPVASAAFLWAAVSWGAAGSGLGLALLAGLALCALGDVLLIPSGTGRLLLAGMVAFGLGHLTFAAAFLGHGVAWPTLAVGAVATALFAAAAWRWLGPRLGPADRLPVALYLFVISLMLVGAAGALGAGAPPGLAVGGALFAASDLAVAQDRFVAPSFASTLWGLPAYYAAQLAIAHGAGALA
jgi:uncharacterized membrane protein YhhN